MRYRLREETTRYANQHGVDAANGLHASRTNNVEHVSSKAHRVFESTFTAEADEVAFGYVRELYDDRGFDDEDCFVRVELIRLPTEQTEEPVRIWGAVSEQDSTGLYAVTDPDQLARMFDERPRQELPQPCPPASTEPTPDEAESEELTAGDFDRQ